MALPILPIQLLLMKLNNAYGKLIADSGVRTLLSKLVGDWDKETIDMEKSTPVLREYVKENSGVLTNERIKIITHLNNLMYAMVDETGVTLSPGWDCYFFENGFRIRKLLAVAVVLEGCNYRRFSMADPTMADVPQCIMRIGGLINMWDDNHKNEHKKKYLDSIKKYADCYVMKYY